MAAVVVAPPRVVPLMVVVEGCWMEREAEAAMEANKTSQCTLYPWSLCHKKGKTFSPSSPPPPPHFHLLTFTLTLSLSISSPSIRTSILPSPSPHSLTLHLLTIHPHFHLLTFTLTTPSHSPPPHPLHATPHSFFYLHTCHPHILTSKLSSLTCVCVWEPPWKAPKSAKLGC